MRPFFMQHATKVAIAALAVILTFAGFAEARDITERRYLRRSHQEWSQRDTGGLSSRDAYRDRRHGYNRERRYNRQYSGGVIGRNDFRGNNRRHFRNDGLSSRDANARHWNRYTDRRNHWDNRGRGGRDFGVREYRETRRSGGRSGNVYGDDRFPTYGPGGTYLGDISAWHERGNGTYFNRDRNGYGYDDGYAGRDDRRAGPKILRVNPRNAGLACSWESGVCVIRR